jgi:hypothetical protein
VPVLLFLGVYFFSGLSRVGTSFDSRWTVYIAMRLWHHGVTNLDEYSKVIRVSDYYAAQCVDASGHARVGPPETCEGHWYNSYPIGGPILETPLVLIAVGVMHALHPLIGGLHSSNPVIEGFLRDDYDAGHALIEMEVASLLLASATVVMYFIARRFLPVNRAVLLSLLFALATPAYSVAGRGLWQHTPSLLFLALIIYMLLRAEERPALAAWAGLPAALAYTCRPTDSLFVLIFTTYVAIRHRRYLGYYLLAAAPVAAIFLAYNLSIYHAILSPYYQSPLAGFYPSNWSKLATGLAGNLISPSRGLFVYTPVFLLAVWSMLRQKWETPLSPWLTALALIHWLAVSAYIESWWAGMCYGPRFFTDLTPVFVLFLIPYFKDWTALSRTLRSAFVALALISLAMSLRGGWSYAVYLWNVDPASVDRHPERNWEWSDPPFLRWRVNVTRR